VRPGSRHGVQPGPDTGANQIRSGRPTLPRLFYRQTKNAGQLTNMKVCVHSQTGGSGPIFKRMYFTPGKRTDFSVAVKSRGKPPNPWRWEIYRAGHPSAVAQSSEFFSTVSAAKKAGDRALAELFEKHDIS
jgi:hypothetical protein